ncbi:MAG: hypothetical protein ACOVNY_01600 [Chitinophagaceae bacterium]
MFKYIFILLVASTLNANAQQRVLAECTISFSIYVSDSLNADKDLAASLKNSTKTVYIKGNDSRTDLVSPAFIQSVLYDKTTGKATILREFGNNKFITKLNSTQWNQENSKYENATVQLLDETKNIAGYTCKKCILKLADGSVFTMYYATTIIPSVREFEYQFKNVPGLVLEYESIETKGIKIKYVATKINTSPVPIAKFIIPTTGYRILYK